MRPEEIQEAVTAFLKKEGMFYEIGFYSQHQWAVERKETIGAGAILTMTFEGPFYSAMNYGSSTQDRFWELMEKLGVEWEQGYAWTIHFYGEGA